jgi:hypothetical protein
MSKLTTKLTALLNAEFKVDITKNTRKRPHVDARKIYARILKDKGWSLQKIGNSIDKHHSTIIHYLKDVEWLIEHDASVREIYMNVSIDFENHIGVDPIHRKTREELLQQIYGLQDENKLLISAIKTLDERLKQEGKYKDIFKTILERLPNEKIHEFQIKVMRILNGL